MKQIVNVREKKRNLIFSVEIKTSRKFIHVTLGFFSVFRLCGISLSSLNTARFVIETLMNCCIFCVLSNKNIPIQRTVFDNSNIRRKFMRCHVNQHFR